jgi:hypothetical protein
VHSTPPMATNGKHDGGKLIERNANWTAPSAAKKKVEKRSNDYKGTQKMVRTKIYCIPIRYQYGKFLDILIFLIHNK